MDLSPQYMIFLYENRSLLDAAKSPFDEICSSQDEYLRLIKKRFEVVRNVAVETHNNLQIWQCDDHNVMHFFPIWEESYWK